MHVCSNEDQSIAFIGSSLSLQAAEKIAFPHLNVRGPARRGDIENAVRQGVKRIYLIDGVLIGDYPPSPYEIVAAMQKGVMMLGAASLGAIRAVELSRHGMLGIGWVYNQYLQGKIVRDDELLVLFTENNFRALTWPLVNLRYAIAWLTRNRKVDLRKGLNFLKRCEQVYFTERTIPTLVKMAIDVGIEKANVNDIFNPRFDIKRLDAMRCIQRYNGSLSDKIRKNEPRRGYWRCTFQKSLIPTVQEGKIDRIGDTTGFDETFIPTSVAIRAGTEDIIWVYSGKGETQEQARLGALMEAVERSSALWDVSQVVIRDVKKTPFREESWEPRLFTYNQSDVTNYVWCLAERIVSKQPVWVPADIVFWGRRPNCLPPSPFKVNTTNGLAANFSREQAVLAGLMEVIERHLVSLLDIRNSVIPEIKLKYIAACLGLSMPKEICDDVDGVIELNTNSLPERCQVLVKRYKRAGYCPRVLALPNKFSLPLFAASVVEQMPNGEFLAAAGYGLKSSPEEACVSALLELAQSRATDRQGAREDCGTDTKSRYDNNCRTSWLLSQNIPCSSYHDILPSVSASCSSPEQICQILEAAEIVEPAIYQFKGISGVSVVRVIIPEVETWHPTGGDSIFGPAAKQLCT